VIRNLVIRQPIAHDITKVSIKTRKKKVLDKLSWNMRETKKSRLYFLPQSLA